MGWLLARSRDVGHDVAIPIRNVSTPILAEIFNLSRRSRGKPCEKRPILTGADEAAESRGPPKWRFVGMLKVVALTHSKLVNISSLKELITINDMDRRAILYTSL